MLRLPRLLVFLLRSLHLSLPLFPGVLRHEAALHFHRRRGLDDLLDVKPQHFMLDLHLAKGDVDKSKVGRYDAKMSRVSVGVKTEARWGN